jgi:uncharacterized protein (TIGR02145 family)
MKKCLILPVLLGILCSCGDETTKVVESKTLDYEPYESIADLPDCSEENEGQMVWVSEEGQLRICADEKWYAMVPKDSSEQQESKWKLSCWTKMSKDSTGYSIICNGDSIGFVHNGKLVESGNKNDDEECLVLFVSVDTIKVACDSLVSVLVRDSTGNMEPQEMELDSEQVALDLENIGGYSQKGPFVTGSEVSVYELQNGRTLKQTGKSFKGVVADDKGSFNVRTVKVASQYAYLVAKGAYLSEINGKKSDAPIQLSAITDLRNRNNVNVNLLTHLEYERVFYLVTNKKKTVAEAKKQARSEILQVFHMNMERFSGEFEDFSIGGSGEGDAVLLAISILLQKEDDASTLSKRVNAISSSIADSGSFNAADLMDLADWASRKDSLGTFARYKENVRKMGLSAKVADFEKYIRNFWNEEYGLGKCDTLGRVVAAKRGSLKDSASRFVCEEHYGAYNWRFASVQEREINEFNISPDGTLDTGASGNIYVYDSVYAIVNSSGWRLTNNVEREHSLCRAQRDSAIVSAYLETSEGCYDTRRNRQYYWCDGENREWKAAQNCSWIDTYGWDPSTDGDTKYGDSVWTKGTWADENNCYVFDSLDGAWRGTDGTACSSGVGGCTRARVGRYFKNESNVYFLCGDDLNLKQLQGYTSEQYLAEDVWQYDCQPWVTGLENTDRHYVCDNGFWRSATDMEEMIGEPCFDQEEKTYSADSVYVCYTGVYVEDFCRKSGPGWKRSAYLNYPKVQRDYLSDELAYDSIVDNRDGRTYKTIKIGEETWLAENMLYLDKKTMKDEGTCFGDSTSTCEMWRQYRWTGTMDILRLYSTSSAVDVISEPQRGICPEGWHVPSVNESENLLAAAGSYLALLSEKRNILTPEGYDWCQSGCAGETMTLVQGTNTTGFSAVCGFKAHFLSQGSYWYYYEVPEIKSCWWTSGEEDVFSAKAFCVGSDDASPFIENRSKEELLPVRCVQDKKGEE